MLLALDENVLGAEDESVCLALAKLFTDINALLIIVEIDSSTRIEFGVDKILSKMIFSSELSSLRCLGSVANADHFNKIHLCHTRLLY